MVMSEREQQSDTVLNKLRLSCRRPKNREMQPGRSSNCLTLTPARNDRAALSASMCSEENGLNHYCPQARPALNPSFSRARSEECCFVSAFATFQCRPERSS